MAWNWSYLPDPLLLYVFSYLDCPNLLRAGQVCRNWHRLSRDNFLWKELFYTDWKIDRSIGQSSSIRQQASSQGFLGEYKRLSHHTPRLESETLHEHIHQVLHVSFSNNGTLFASCSKDGYIKVWNADYPATVRHVADMKVFSWNYTQFSQFNKSDTLLLVSGVHFGTHTASGEIAVFSLQDGFTLQCRVLNKPYDLFGTWYTDEYLLSGRLHFLGHLVSCSALWLNKASQESDSEHKPIIKRLFKFYNRNASSIRTIMVADCHSPRPEAQEGSSHSSNGQSQTRCGRHRPGTNWNSHHHLGSEGFVKGNPVSHNALSSSPRNWLTRLRHRRRSQEVNITYGSKSKEACTMDSPIHYSQEYRHQEAKHNMQTTQDELSQAQDESSEEEESSSSSLRSPCSPTGSKEVDGNLDSCPEDEEESEGRILEPKDKLLIFTTGSLTYTPHQIGIKRIKPFKFAECVRETATLESRIQEKMMRKQRRNTPGESPSLSSSPLQPAMYLESSSGEEEDAHQEDDMWYEPEVDAKFDSIDHIIDLHGHIIGMGLSPDHRYLYVNTRPWPKHYSIERPLTPPPIAQEIDIHVIDLVTLKEVGTMLQSHKAYTPNDECFFIFLDVSEQYVASGAEDKHGYLWDRHFGNCLARLPHSDVVNSVAFNPQDPEMLVTASDDYTLKVWRSRNRLLQLGIQPPTQQ